MASQGKWIEPGLLRFVEAAPVNLYIKEQGPIEAILYHEASDILFVFLPHKVLPYRVAMKAWMPPLELQGTFYGVTPAHRLIFMATSAGIFSLEVG